ncbi:inositol monophosphatase family protein [Qipengyuania marisflavi]|uniref:Inositol monophosphatase n=1 Tax=Qipengyuania marisflavi TaxID=2486356 RepID=A0A5S3PAB3_9SPHN|nr:inositol monophosphatase family protein [Qipengyuania marisflavi]TMM50454.1 inositol monophosphatase [Qipengyuania marisflavi]
MEALLRRVTQSVIMPRYQTLAADEIIQKGEDDLVTIADREAEVMLAEGLTALVPGLPIVGEEAADADPTVLDRLKSDCWIIDPIDGTHNFASGKPPFGILIAMVSGGIAHTGWIFDCLTGRLCIAHQGKGAYINGEQIQAQTTGATPPVAAISVIFMDPEQRTQVKAHIAPHYTLVDTPRCAAEQYPRLVLGQNDVSIFERTLAWDHAAGVLFLNEAGGKVARMDGSAYRVDEQDSTGLIGAASPALWNALATRYQSLS